MARLLTDEEKNVIAERHFHGYDGHDASGIADDASQAQDIKTLKAVGEWLEEHFFFYHYHIKEEEIDQLKQGKMPEEE